MKKTILVFSLLFTSLAFATDDVPPPSPVDNTPPPAAAPTNPAPAPSPAGQPIPALQPSTGPTPALAPAAAPTAPVSQVAQSENDIPTAFRPDSPVLNAKVGAGIAFKPTAFWLTADVEGQFDKFIALGPKLQWGENSDTDFILGSFGPRFILPFNYFELGLQGGLGFAYRNVVGFELTNFLWETAINFDMYITPNISLGLNYTSNITSAPAQKFISALTLAISGHF